MPRFGIEFTLVDGRDLDAWRKAVRRNTQVFFFETPTNPQLDIIDIAGVSDIAHDAGAISSSTTCSRRRCCRSRSQHRADVVVYSATKHIDGQGRTLGGVMLGSKELIKRHYHD